MILFLSNLENNVPLLYTVCKVNISRDTLQDVQNKVFIPYNLLSHYSLFLVLTYVYYFS